MVLNIFKIITTLSILLNWTLCSSQEFSEKKICIFQGDIDSNFNLKKYKDEQDILLLIDEPFFYVELLKMRGIKMLDTVDLMTGKFHFFLEKLLLTSEVHGTCQPMYRYDFFREKLKIKDLNKVNYLLSTDSTNINLKLMNEVWLNYNFKLSNQIIDSIIPLFNNLSSIQEKVIRYQFSENKNTPLDFWIKYYSTYEIVLLSEHIEKIPYKVTYYNIVNREKRTKKLKDIQKKFHISKRTLLKNDSIILEDGSEIKLILID